MEKLFLVLAVSVLGFASTCAATSYTVGDSAGWDISADLPTWASTKRFAVGDVLLFQYSSSHSLDEVTKEDFSACNTTNILQSYTNGNTTVPLTKPGSKYFVCGNNLHCLGGMKLQVDVEGNQADSPASAPQAASGANLPQPSSKSVPTSDGFVRGARETPWLAFLGLVSATFLWGLGF